MQMLAPKRVSTKSISSLKGLCDALDVTLTELRHAYTLPEDDKYSRLERPKSDGTVRVVYKPHPLIRKIQRRLNARIFSSPSVLAWPDFIYGSIPNQPDGNGGLVEKDYIACARVHCGAKSVLKVDIKDFFDNVHRTLVMEILQGLLKYSNSVCKVLTKICTRNDVLVQGGLTSSYLAGLCLFDVEGRVVEKLRRKGLRYTRLVDDITVSTTIANYDFSYATALITDMLHGKDLPVNSKKCQVLYVSSLPLTVHGLRVNFKEPRLPANEVARIRASVRNVELLSSESNYRTSHSYRHDFNRCMGRVNKLKRIGHKQHGELVRRLAAIKPLPSRRDIERARKLLERLEREWNSKKDSYGYLKRFHVLHERLNVLARSFPAISTEIRKAMRGLKPVYE